MLNMKEFMEKTGVTKKKYVNEWVEKELIPGVERNETTGELFFPDSARRPYTSRCKPGVSASKIRISIVNASIKRQHVMPDMFYVSQEEFQSYIDDLVGAELIAIRIEDGITYYDSTAKSDEYKGKSIKEIAKLVNGCIRLLEAVRGIALAVSPLAKIAG